MIKKDNKLSIADIARRIGVTEQTVKNWIVWYEQNTDKTDLVLPKCEYVKAGSRLYRLYAEKDVKYFQNFKDKRLARWGKMASYNAVHCWGNYGKKLLARRAKGEQNGRKRTKNNRNA